MPLSADSMRFLIENRQENSQAWFTEHKTEYQKFLIEPLKELVEQLAPYMKEIDSFLVVEPRVNACISRIFRDTRFSKDKSLYREVMWIVFTRNRHTHICPPGFVLEFSPMGFRYGCGYYQIPLEKLKSMRNLIIADSSSFRKADEAVRQQKIFAFEGEMYKRILYPAQSSEKQNWLQRKNLLFMHNSQDFDLLFSADLYKTLARDFKILQPVYDFLLKL